MAYQSVHLRVIQLEYKTVITPKQTNNMTEIPEFSLEIIKIYCYAVEMLVLYYNL